MVIPRGIEPLLPPWKGGVLTSWPRDQMAPPVGLEPTTLRLTAACSTSWAIEEYLKSAKGQTKICSFAKLFWQRLMFPGSHPPSIFSAEKLNFCVRYGYRCDLLAIATKYDYTFFKSVCNKTNQFYQTLNVNKSLSCDVFMTTVATLLFKSVCYTN